MRKDWYSFSSGVLLLAVGVLVGLAAAGSVQLSDSVADYVSAIAAASVALTAWSTAKAWRRQIVFEREFDSLQELRAALSGLNQANDLFKIYGSKWADRIFPGEPDNIFKISTANIDREQTSLNVANARAHYRACCQKCESFVSSKMMDMTPDKVDDFIGMVDSRLNSASTIVSNIYGFNTIVKEHSATLERKLNSAAARIESKLEEMRKL
tara:strand:- start:204 stop:836 length:633 start_codon:yes stop_codon:yes gene_type:complete